jgi:hypothetical protein
VLNNYLQSEQNLPLTHIALDELNGVKTKTAAEALSIYLQENLITQSGKRFITSRK